MASTTIHNRSNSYNALSAVSNAPQQQESRHKPNASGNIPTFAFSFGGGKAPPTSQAKAEQENRRASQMIHHSGFLNRNVGTGLRNLSKNWKAYKAEIRGPKLYFYKPTGEKANAIKDLFPIQFGQEGPEELEPPSPGVHDLSDTSSTRGEGRKRRLFWGPGRHPDILLDHSGIVVGGSFEALLYEVVFAATFPNDLDWEWKQFSRRTLLSMPTTMGQDQFEVDFQAALDRYLRYAEDDVRQHRQARVEWILTLYAEYYHPHGFPPNLQTFVHSFSLTITPRQAQPPSFKLPLPTSPIRTPKSPNEKPALKPSTSYSSDAGDNAHPGLLADLRYKGTMSRERLLSIDFVTLAQSLELLVMKDAIMSRGLVTAHPILSCIQNQSPPWPAFSESRARPHWLTHFIVTQIVARSDGSVSYSSTHTRASALGKWICVADHARLTGNECVWLAIITALVSKPIARLDKAWRRVEPRERQILEAWVRGDVPLMGSAQHQVPWLTEPSRRFQKNVQQLQNQRPCEIATFKNILDTIETVQDYFDKVSVDDFEVSSPDVLDLFHLWEFISARDILSIKPIDEYIAESLQAEPVQFGRLAQYFHQPRSASYHLHALVPFAFPEALPSLAFLDRSELVRSRKDSFDKQGNPTPHDFQIEHLERLKFFPSEQMKSHWSSREGLELDNTTFRLFAGELIVRVVKEKQSTSRPTSLLDSGAVSLSRRPSRAPSIRVKPQAASTLERKSSNARRQSMPLLNNGRPKAAQAEGVAQSPADPQVPVVIVGGTIEKLVDVLVRGLDYVLAATSDDNGEMALTDRRARGLKLDRDDYSRTWWSTYRSFMTPETFIAMLRRMYRTTITPATVTLSSQELVADANLRMAILTVVNEWLMDGGGVVDVLDQPDLYYEVDSWLTNEREQATPAAALTNEQDRVTWKEVEDARKTLYTIFRRQTKRPPLRHLSAYESGAYETSDRAYGPKLPDPDALSPQQLIEQLDAIGSVGIRMLQAEDLVSCMEILEIQSKDKTGWILLTDLPTLSQDEMIIQNIYNHLTLVEPSPLLSDFPPTPRLINLAQPSIRSMLHCFDQARKWATAVLAQPAIPIEMRQRRMEKFLQALDLCRALSSKTDGVEDGAPVIRSFVETVLTAAILSPESRMYHRAWYHTAAQRQVALGNQVINVDSLEALVRPVSRDQLPFQPGFKLAVDFGWMVERLLELISMPDSLVNTTDALGPVINFEKRRQLHTFILNMPTLAMTRPSKLRSQLNSMDMSRLSRMHEWAVEILFESNGNVGISQKIKDEASRENAWAPSGATSRKYPRPFSKVVLLQQEKNKRDRHIRERLLREKRMEQHKKEKQGVPYDKAMEVAKKTKQGKRTSLNPFMRVVRPLSTAFPFGGGPITESMDAKKWTLEELSAMPTTKPAFTIDLAGARVEESTKSPRPFVFYMDTEDGARYWFQATTKKEMQNWMAQLSKTGKNTAAKRRTYVGPHLNTTLPDLYRTPNLGRHPTAVFAVPLEFLIEREYGSIQPNFVPSFLHQCLTEIENRGFVEDGIYRIPGSKARIDRLKAQVNTGVSLNLYEEDIHNVCSLVKLWIREIPDGLVPGECFWMVIDAIQSPERSETARLMRQAVLKLPLAHFNVLKRLISHLCEGCEHEDQTRMAEKQFSLVFAQTVLTPPEKDGVKGMNAGFQCGNRIIEFMLHNYHVIFEGSNEVEEDEEEDDDHMPGRERVLGGVEEEDEEEEESS